MDIETVTPRWSVEAANLCFPTMGNAPWRLRLTEGAHVEFAIRRGKERHVVAVADEGIVVDGEPRFDWGMLFDGDG